MVDLELTDAALTDGAEVVTLEEITEKPSLGFCGDFPIERAFYLSEEFSTFSCMETYGDLCCEFSLFSQIPWMEHYAWAIFGHHNLKFDREDEVSRKVCGKSAFVNQKFCFELNEGEDYGYFQLICIPEHVIYDGIMYNKFDLITFIAYKDRKVARTIAQPVTLRPKLEQTYIPLINNQHIQIVLSEKEELDVDESCFHRLKELDKLFNLGKDTGRERLHSRTYVFKPSDTVSPIFVKDKCISIPPLSREDNGIYATITKPISKAIVHSEGIDGVHIISPDKVQWAWDENLMDMEETNLGVVIHIKSKINNVYIERDDKDVWWVYENQNIAVGSL